MQCDGSAAATRGSISPLRAFSNASREGGLSDLRASARKSGVPLGTGAENKPAYPLCNLRKNGGTSWARIQPSPVVRLNEAVAIGMTEAPRRGLSLIDQLGASRELDRYHLYHAARADMLRRLGSFEAAAEAYRRALALMANGVERAFLERRLAAL
jgi:hypothetical protein